ncbi:hypothetical protein [Bacillus pseudomycoides]|uniref:hypothetical protein n=1 Tax=Bacillus pseudomycoides TaxID=64104 RepID=UPI000BFBA1C4|nr:hypothetical protein [Bacillus pseudomycoides]PHE46922.1 hypothetical protein COF53_14855 [Bacillus pseudomycoides]
MSVSTKVVELEWVGSEKSKGFHIIGKDYNNHNELFRLKRYTIWFSNQIEIHERRTTTSRDNEDYDKVTLLPYSSVEYITLELHTISYLEKIRKTFTFRFCNKEREVFSLKDAIIDTDFTSEVQKEFFRIQLNSQNELEKKKKELEVITS